MVRSALLFAVAAATAVSAEKHKPLMGQKLLQKNLLKLGMSQEAVNMGLNDCPIGQSVCDSDFCIPIAATCCDFGNGGYCEILETCSREGCCPVGRTCTGPPTECRESGKKLCGIYCIDEDGECCDEDDGSYCSSGETCTSNGCSGGSSRGGGGGGGSGGGSGGSGGTPGGSGEEEQCYSFQEECGDGCMPRGSTCCENQEEYCLPSQTCNNDGTCRRGSGFGGSGGDDDDDDDDAEESEASGSSFSFPRPSASAGGGNDDDDDTPPSSGGGGSGDDDDDDSNDDDRPVSGGPDRPQSGGDGPQDEDAATVHGPSLVAAAVALMPLLLL